MRLLSLRSLAWFSAGALVAVASFARADDTAPPSDPGREPVPAVPAPPPPPAPAPIPDASAPMPSPAPAAVAPSNAPAAPAPCVTRVDMLPARCTWVERTVDVPAVTAERRVPIMETVKVPVFEERRTPVTEQVDVPVMATREVPVVAERSVPEFGTVAVPVYEQRSERVNLTIPNIFGCDDFCLPLWKRCKTVETGTRMEQGIVGYHSEPVSMGTRSESYVSGFEKKTVTVGERSDPVQVGTRDETREVGSRTETVVVVPATKQVVREQVTLPAEPVTVVVSGDPKAAAPQQGTTRVLSEDEFRRELAQPR